MDGSRAGTLARWCLGKGTGEKRFMWSASKVSIAIMPRDFFEWAGILSSLVQWKLPSQVDGGASKCREGEH